MEYTVQALSRLAGVSPRTLRYYESFGLLQPIRQSNGYRIYGSKEVDRLQQILFYRALDVPLEEIRALLGAPSFDAKDALEGHLAALHARRAQLDRIIATVEQTIGAMKGECTMTDQEKFQGFTEKLVEDNEARYGQEARQRYGDEAVDRANAKVKGMGPEAYEALQALSERLNETLHAAFLQGDPGAPLAQQACDLHRQWLCFYWDAYTPEAHRGLAQMYVDDAHFTAYYDRIAPGCAVFLRDAVNRYTQPE